MHPGIRGDRGPSALDWAVLDGETQWGVTVLQAEAGMDAGPVWAWREFPLRDATKGQPVSQRVTAAAVEGGPGRSHAFQMADTRRVSDGVPIRQSVGACAR